MYFYGTLPNIQTIKILCWFLSTVIDADELAQDRRVGRYSMPASYSHVRHSSGDSEWKCRLRDSENHFPDCR